MLSIPCLLLALVASPNPHAGGSTRVPGEEWLAYADPAEAGFSPKGLADARAYIESLEAAATFVVHDGAVLLALGEPARRFQCHAIRNSLMNGLWGVHTGLETLDLDVTLAKLGIDDSPEPLGPVERRATILDLMKARSGIFRPAAAEPPGSTKPERHSCAPGERWCYNNWDFNALVTIYQRRFEVDFFEDFERRLARPLGLQDFRRRDGHYLYERDKSEHPAYPFRMSARDLARFGLLFLNEGRWGAQQLIPSEWIERSTTSYSDAWAGEGYGMGWWVSRSSPFVELRGYSAIGFGGHAIDVLPGADLVVVVRVDTFERESMRRSERLEFLRKLLAARAGEPRDDPRLVPLRLEERERRPIVELTPRELRAYVGELQAKGEEPVRIVLEGERQLVIEIPRSGRFGLRPLGGDLFELEDARYEVALERGPDGHVRAVLYEGVLNREGYQLLRVGKLEEALAIFRKNARYFPHSANVHDSLGDGLTAAGSYEAALESYRRAVELGRATGDPQLEIYERNLEASRAKLGRR